MDVARGRRKPLTRYHWTGVIKGEKNELSSGDACKTRERSWCRSAAPWVARPSSRPGERATDECHEAVFLRNVVTAVSPGLRPRTRHTEWTAVDPVARHHPLGLRSRSSSNKRRTATAPRAGKNRETSTRSGRTDGDETRTRRPSAENRAPSTEHDYIGNYYAA